MKTVKYEIIRLVSGNVYKTGANIHVLKGWYATSLYVAARLCALAQARFGGQWDIAHNGADTVTVWVGYTHNDFKRKVA